MNTIKQDRITTWAFLCGLVIFLLVAAPADLFGRRGRGGDSGSSGSSGRDDSSFDDRGSGSGRRGGDDSSGRSFDDRGSSSGRRGSDDSSGRFFDDRGSGSGRSSGSSGSFRFDDSSGRGRGRGGRDDFFILRTVGYDRPILVTDLGGGTIIHRRRTEFVFFDRHRSFVHHRIVQPDFFFLASFSAGPHYTFVPVYPYHHRRFIFVNPVGYWPDEYHYYRYYQYGCSPYGWYGPQPVPRQVGDTYNYYTYNYADPAAVALPAEAPAYTPPAELPIETDADRFFDTAVRAFEAGNFRMATTQFALAYQAAPNDKVLPFAYAQALFAVGDYKLAGPVLSGAIARIRPIEEGIFYPRGLYADENMLFAQVEALQAAAALNPTDRNLQFLLGYHYLGLGELDNAEGPLVNATADASRGPASQSLLQLLDTLKAARQQEAQMQAVPAQP